MTAVTPIIPAITDAEARDDREWFFANPRRRYRLRQGAAGWWLVRRRGNSVLLRVWAAEVPPGLPDTDAALRVAWFTAAWGFLDPDELDALIRGARKAERAAARVTARLDMGSEEPRIPPLAARGVGE